MARSKVGIKVVGPLVWHEAKDCWVAIDPVKVDRDHDLATAANFVVDAYIPDTNPREFTWKGETMDLANFAIVTAHELGWTGRVNTFYRKLDTTLINADLRVREYSTRTYKGREIGRAHV